MMKSIIANSKEDLERIPNHFIRYDIICDFVTERYEEHRIAKFPKKFLSQKEIYGYVKINPLVLRYIPIEYITKDILEK